MSKVCLFSIFDTKSNVYGPVMSFVNDNTAIRAFMEMLVNPDPNSLLSLYPADYLLYCVGIFDNETGVIESLPAPAHIISGMEASTRAVVEAQKRREMTAKLRGEPLTSEVVD